jgi:hypothetical protein
VRSLVLKLKGKPFAVIGFNVNDRESNALAATMEAADLPWRSFQFDAAVARQWHPFTPTFFVLDPQGVIRYKWAGGIGASAMDAGLEEVLSDAARSTK